MIFGIKKINNFDPYNVFLAIATNIPQRLKTGFVLQGHILLGDVSSGNPRLELPFLANERSTHLKWHLS